jgi:elongation factor G
MAAVILIARPGGPSCEETAVNDLANEWPRIVDVTESRIHEGPPGGADALLVDSSGRTHTLKLSPRATVLLCLMLSRHPDASQSLLEQRIGGAGFRVDEFTPVLQVAIEPLDKSSKAAAHSALAALVGDDPQLRLSLDEDSGVLTLAGLDVLQLDRKIDALRAAYAGELRIGPLEIGYREQITQRAEIDHSHKALRFGVGEFARVKLVLEPVPYWQGIGFNGVRMRQAISEEQLAAVERGVRSCLRTGVLSGHPVIGIRLLLVEAEAHATDSPPLAFELAARAAMMEGLRQGAPVLLEPIMRVDVVVPEAHAAAIVEEIKGRRGEVDGRGRRSPDGIVIAARIPAANLMGFPSVLRSIAGEGATHLPQFDGYATVPGPGDLRFRPAAALRA